MPSLLHESLIDLFRHRPSLAAELLRDVLHAPVPAFEAVRMVEGNLGDLLPIEFRADLVLLLEGARPAAGERPLNGSVIVEVQLTPDPEKRRAWPVYVTVQRARSRCNVTLLVVTNDPAVARWAATPIETGHPGFVLTPLVLGPGTIPRVVDEAQAAGAPELAVLSVLVHGQGPDAVDIAKAALAGTRGLDDERAALYIDLVLAFMNEAARSILEALMANGTYQYQSDFAKRYVAEGEAKGLREAVTHVLATRKLALSELGRTRLASCSDVATLTAWLARAVTAASEAEVFAGTEGT